MKTERFYIQFASCGSNMSTQFEISKTEYNNQLKHLQEQMKSTADYEYPVEELEMSQPSIEGEFAVTHQRCFTCGGGDVVLSRVVCKPGYKFKAKK